MCSRSIFTLGNTHFQEERMGSWFKFADFPKKRAQAAFSVTEAWNPRIPTDSIIITRAFLEGKPRIPRIPNLIKKDFEWLEVFLYYNWNPWNPLISFEERCFNLVGIRDSLRNPCTCAQGLLLVYLWNILVKHRLLFKFLFEYKEKYLHCVLCIVHCALCTMHYAL